MDTYFALDADGGVWPSLVGDGKDSPRALMDEAWVGPMGFLELLETRLGLGGLYPSLMERALALVGKLEAKEDFWSASLAKDPIATARVLLGWRDELCMGGWDGKSGGARLEALGAACAALEPGIPDRLAAICEIISAGRSPEMANLYLLDAPELLKPLWRKVIDAMEYLATGVRPMECPASQSKGDLAGAREKDFAPKGDGGLVLLRPYGPMAAAEEVAAWLAEQDDLSDTLIIGGDEVLDAALHRYGLPTLGGRGADRPELLSLLGLVIEMGRDPIDPELAARLLNLSVCPVPRGVARRLAGALAEWPAVGSEKWDEELERGLEKIDEDRRDKVRGRVEAIFTPGVTRGEDYPTAELLARVELLAGWLRGMKMSRLPEEAVAPAETQLNAFRRMLKAYGQAALKDAELIAILRAATRQAEETKKHPAQAGLASIPKPGAVAGEAGCIIWWNFVRRPFESPLVPLSPAEKTALEEAGVELMSLDAMAASEAERWGRPLTFAKARLILVCPERDEAGEQAHPHPLWDEIVARLGKDASAEPLTRRGLDDVPRKPRELSPLPEFRYRYQVDEGLLDHRDQESPNSAETLISCPFKYVLKYTAKLNAGSSSSVQVANQKMVEGKMAHEFIGNALMAFQGKTPDPEAVTKAALAAFEQEGPRMAAMLFLPEQKAEKAAFLNLLESAARDLSRRLASKGQKVAGVEQQLVGKGAGVDFGGQADLLLEDPKSILDLKRSWANGHLQHLKGGKALQLAAYSKLHRSGKEIWPPVGYYVLDEQRLLSVDAGVFEGAEEVEGPSMEDTWRLVEQALADCWQELREGLVRLGLIKDEDKKKIEGQGVTWVDPWLEANCKFCDYGVICGRARGGE